MGFTLLQDMFLFMWNCCWNLSTYLRPFCMSIVRIKTVPGSSLMSTAGIWLFNSRNGVYRYTELNHFLVGWTKFQFFELRQQEWGQGCIKNKYGTFWGKVRDPWGQKSHVVNSYWSLHTFVSLKLTNQIWKEKKIKRRQNLAELNGFCSIAYYASLGWSFVSG